jgi:hypothetical protein
LGSRLSYPALVNWEARKDRSEALSTARMVPTQDVRNGIFTYQRKDGTIGKLTPADVKGLDPLGIGESPAVDAPRGSHKYRAGIGWIEDIVVGPNAD